MTQDSTLSDNNRLEPRDPPNQDERARKRLAIGLAAQRPTAKAAPQRPPDEPTSSMQRWWPVFLLTAVAVATLLLLAAKVVNSPTGWTPVRQNLAAWWSGESPVSPTNPPHYRLQIAEDFDTASALLAGQQQANQWWMSVIPTQGVYRMVIWPSHVAWSTLGVRTPPAFKLEAALSVLPETPDGYVGLLDRYQNPDNFYFFVIDGQRRFQAQLHKAGVLYPLQPWIALDFLHPPGQNNVMALTDDGTVIRLYLNNTVVYAVLDAQLPAGQTGVIGGAADHAPAKLDIDWLKLYDQPY